MLKRRQDILETKMQVLWYFIWTGDRKYTQKSERYYNKLGLRAIVKNVPENRQPQVIGGLVRKYNPDIIVITRAWPEWYETELIIMIYIITEIRNTSWKQW